MLNVCRMRLEYFSVCFHLNLELQICNGFICAGIICSFRMKMGLKVSYLIANNWIFSFLLKGLRIIYGPSHMGHHNRYNKKNCLILFLTSKYT